MQIRRLLPTDAAAYQALRLAALRDEPFAFGSSYEEERDTSLEAVAQRLAPRSDHGFIGAFDGELPDGTVKVLVEGVQRARLETIESRDEMFFARAVGRS